MARRKSDKQDRAVYVKLDDKLFDEVVYLAEMYGCNRSDVIRASVRAISCYRQEIIESGGTFVMKED